MKIGQVAAKSRLSASAIRFYQKEGLIAEPSRINGRRAFEDDVLHELVVIRFAKETGFTLPEIKLLLHGFPERTPASARWKRMAAAKIAEMDEVIAKAEAMKTVLQRVMGCRCQTLRQCAQGMARNAEQRHKILSRRSRTKSN